MKAMDVVKIVGIIGAGVVAYKFVVAVKQAGGDIKTAAVKVITEDLNPASRENVVYKGVNSVGSSVSGNSDWTLGGAIYDLFNPDPMALMAANDPSNVSTQGKQITSGENAKTAFQQSEKRSLANITGVYDMQFGDDSSKQIVNGINFNNF